MLDFVIHFLNGNKHHYMYWMIWLCMPKKEYQGKLTFIYYFSHILRGNDPENHIKRKIHILWEKQGVGVCYFIFIKLSRMM